MLESWVERKQMTNCIHGTEPSWCDWCTRTPKKTPKTKTAPKISKQRKTSCPTQIGRPKGQINKRQLASLQTEINELVGKGTIQVPPNLPINCRDAYRKLVAAFKGRRDYRLSTQQKVAVTKRFGIEKVTPTFRTMKEVGALLGLTETGAAKSVQNALQKLFI